MGAGFRAYCTKPAHPETEAHQDENLGPSWFEGDDRNPLLNGGQGVDVDSLSGERDTERVPSDPIVDSAGRRGVPGQESTIIGDVVQDAVDGLIAAIRAESERELDALRAENTRLQQLILDAGTVITAAVGSIGEPREWSVKRDDALSTPRYRETFLGPKRARQWKRLEGITNTFKAEDVALWLQMGHGAASSLLRDAEREGKAERVSRGVYRVAR
jgi:hypothetical protein